jgi:hypothetical protein
MPSAPKDEMSSPCQKSFTDRSHSNHRVQLAIIKANNSFKILMGAVVLTQPLECSATHHRLYLTLIFNVTVYEQNRNESQQAGHPRAGRHHRDVRERQ